MHKEVHIVVYWTIVERDKKCIDRDVLNKVTFRLASKDAGVHIIVEKRFKRADRDVSTSDLQTSF